MVRKWLWRVKVRWPNLGRWLLVVLGLLVGAAGGWWLTLKDWQREDLVFRAKWAINKRIEQVRSPVTLPDGEMRPHRRFATCEQARNAGYGNMRAGEPSYRPEQDEDKDGVACEPYP